MYGRMLQADASTKDLTDKSLRSTRNRLYPREAWYCIGLFICIIAAFQWIAFFHSKLERRGHTCHTSDPEQTHLRRRDRFSWRRIPLGLVNAYRVITFRWTFQIGTSYNLTMAEVLMTMAYVTFIFVWAFINTTNLEGNKLDLTYWCNRSGTLAASQFPLITALGTKNNIVSLITSISYDKLNYVHRMMSRVVFVLLCVHTGGEVVRNAPFEPLLRLSWLKCGIIAFSSLAILCVFSLRPIRARSYELFFYVHFAMVLMFLVGAYFHTQNNAVAYWIYPCFPIWALDRIIRVLRLVVFNFKYESESAADATAELLSDDFVRLRFHRPSHFHWAPGQTVYLIMPSVSRLPFEAHPFTIASSDSSRFDVLEGQTIQDKASTPVSLSERSPDSTAPFWNELVFFINVRKGFTARLKEAALRGNPVKVFVDGPYGSLPDMDSYDTSVLIAGGSGVSYTLPVLVDMIERVCTGKSSCRRMVFIWSIRNAEHIRWIDETLIRTLHLVPPSLYVAIRIHVTGAQANTRTLPYTSDANPTEVYSGVAELDDANIIEKRRDSIFALEVVRLKNGRCDLASALRDEVEMATGRMSVSVCGSQSIAQSVRGALRFPVSGPLSIANGGPSVSLHVESFGYA